MVTRTKTATLSLLWLNLIGTTKHIAIRYDRLHSPRDPAAPLTHVTLSLVQQLQITNPANKRTMTATVRDLCPGCPSGNLGESRPPPASAWILTFHTDMSPALFEGLADDLNKGTFKMTWQYV